MWEANPFADGSAFHVGKGYPSHTAIKRSIASHGHSHIAVSTLGAAHGPSAANRHSGRTWYCRVQVPGRSMEIKLPSIPTDASDGRLDLCV